MYYTQEISDAAVTYKIYLRGVGGWGGGGGGGGGAGGRESVKRDKWDIKNRIKGN
ncbi:hypothetical protein [Pseudoalteromonas phenolica]|uniref:hypothetical protein n=1 Tax=Pseudoalteromonas phenolica TaxID=161398 RepID=UPI001486CCC5|nr:hypothetical protein [Pseudoalteromonas phenolica]